MSWSTAESTLAEAWESLTEEKRSALQEADARIRLIALETAAVVASALRPQDMPTRVSCARKFEKDVLELAAKDLQVLVLHTAATPHALDGQIPFSIESGTGRVGIEVKSGLTTISTEEVDKFRNDLSLSAYAAGVFVSLRAPISKIPRGIHVQRELSTAGPTNCVYVSPVQSDHLMQNLTRSALATAITLAKTRASYPDTDRAELLMDAQEVGTVVQREIDAIGQVRKRMREDDEVHRKRVDRASDALVGVQHRLQSSVQNLWSKDD